MTGTLKQGLLIHDKKEISLTKNEEQILRVLMKGRTVGIQELEELFPAKGSSSRVRTAMSRLRTKLPKPYAIVSVYGQGYHLIGKIKRG